jgi:hypothetical protein
MENDAEPIDIYCWLGRSEPPYSPRLRASACPGRQDAKVAHPTPALKPDDMFGAPLESGAPPFESPLLCIDKQIQFLDRPAGLASFSEKVLARSEKLIGAKFPVVPKTIKGMPEHSRPRKSRAKRARHHSLMYSWLRQFSEWEQAASISAACRGKWPVTFRYSWQIPRAFGL